MEAESNKECQKENNPEARRNGDWLIYYIKQYQKEVPMAFLHTMVLVGRCVEEGHCFL